MEQTTIAEDVASGVSRAVGDVVLGPMLAATLSSREMRAETARILWTAAIALGVGIGVGVYAGVKLGRK